MKEVAGGILVILMALGAGDLYAQDGKGKNEKSSPNVSFKKDVFPIIGANCLPCHAEDNFNPSELSLDSYDLLMAGGKNGKPVGERKVDESLLLRKLSEDPPFGDRMPLNSKKKIKDGKAKWLTEKEIETIANWIAGGAKNN